MKLAETLEHISTIAFPDIHCDWHTIDSEARPSAIFEALKKWNEVGNFVHDNFKEGISLLVSTIEAGIFDNETKSVAMQLLAALCEEGAGYCRNEQYRSGTRNEVILDLFQSNDMFVRTVIDNSLYTPTLNAALLAESFFHLDESSFKTVCDKCIRDQFPNGPIPDSLKELLTNIFRYNHDFECLVTEENVYQLWAMGVYLDSEIPELHFFECTKDGMTLDECKRDMDAIRYACDLLDRISRGDSWVAMESVPDQLELHFKYPNGKKGDIIRYLFEEYGSVEKQTSLEWFGRINKVDIDVLGCISPSLGLYSAVDSDFLELFEKHHLPTMVWNKLENQNTHYFKQLLYAKTDEFRKRYKLNQRQSQEAFYTEAVLSGNATPKWKNEFQLFALIKDIYEDAIYQYHSNWLGAQSIDIFIPSLKVGIEYQGRQHYEPIEFFGGEQGFEDNKKRDARKRALCFENGVKLIEWPYTENITFSNLKCHLHDMGIDI